MGVVYRPPHAPFIEGTDFISDLRDSFQIYSTKVILGDFNADQLSSSADACFIRAFIDENSLYSVPFGPTHHTATSVTWLDLCLIDALDNVTEYWKTDTPFKAGHDLITATLNINIPSPVKTDFTYRDFKSLDASELNKYLQSCDWSVITGGSASLDECLDCFCNNLNAALDISAPLKTVKYRKRRHPWFTHYHRALNAERDRFYRLSLIHI